MNFFFLVEETLEIKVNIRLNLNWPLTYRSLYANYTNYFAYMFDII